MPSTKMSGTKPHLPYVENGIINDFEPPDRDSCYGIILETPDNRFVFAEVFSINLQDQLYAEDGYLILPENVRKKKFFQAFYSYLESLDLEKINTSSDPWSFEYFTYEYARSRGFSVFIGRPTFGRKPAVSLINKKGVVVEIGEFPKDISLYGHDCYHILKICFQRPLTDWHGFRNES